jgi:hypothetical protein
MKSITLDDLLMVHMNNPYLWDFIPDKTVDEWYYAIKKTVKYIGSHCATCSSVQNM